MADRGEEVYGLELDLEGSSERLVPTVEAAAAVAVASVLVVA